MTGKPLLETPKQLAKRTGLSERQIRHLIDTGQLEHVPVGCRVFVAAGALEKFVAERTVK
jgi:excisionase family DNA binding protein